VSDRLADRVFANSTVSDMRVARACMDSNVWAKVTFLINGWARTGPLLSYT
jgi:hypothetical protein